MAGAWGVHTANADISFSCYGFEQGAVVGDMGLGTMLTQTGALAVSLDEMIQELGSREA